MIDADSNKRNTTPRMPMNLLDGSAGLADRTELDELVFLYATALDRRLPTLLDKVFAKDGVLIISSYEDSSATSTVFHSRDGWDIPFRWINRLVFTSHFIGNRQFEVYGDNASGETYCIAHEHTDTSAGHSLTVRHIRYLDKFIRSDGRWWLMEREARVDWTEIRDADLNPSSAVIRSV